VDLVIYLGKGKRGDGDNFVKASKALASFTPMRRSRSIASRFCATGKDRGQSFQ
jgi:hypothetical protein